MKRYVRLAVLVAALVVLVAGTALATQSPRLGQQGPLNASPEQPEAPPTADELARVVEKLADQDIDANVDQLSALAAEYGLGGAVRLVAWADASGMSIADLRALVDGGAGWGKIAHDLELDVNPGIGWIMGNGGGHGRDNAPGQLKPKPGDEGASE
jgi:hypothetical protein